MKTAFSYTNVDYDKSATPYTSQIQNCYRIFYSPLTAISSITIFHNQFVHLLSYKQLDLYELPWNCNYGRGIFNWKYMNFNPVGTSLVRNFVLHNKISSDTRQLSKVAHNHPSVYSCCNNLCQCTILVSTVSGNMANNFNRTVLLHPYLENFRVLQ
jgi:hypothetical protein